MSLFNVILQIHIVVGFIALVVGLVAMFVPKGQKVHNTAGKIYFGSMLIIALTSTILSLLGPLNLFLLVVGIFSFYLTFTGYRTTKVKNQAPQLIDKLVTGLMLVTTVAIVFLNIYFWNNGKQNLTIILSIFGTIGGTLALADVWRYFKGYDHPREWLLAHLGRMCGAYIATFTAFAVTNLTAFFPKMLLWTLPPIAGALTIQLATAYYRKQYNISKKNSK